MSSSRFEIKRVKKQPILSITKTVKVAGIGAVFAQVFGEISAYMAENGFKQVSSPVAIYHSFSHNEVEVEAGIPVNGDALNATPSNVERTVMPLPPAMYLVLLLPCGELAKTLWNPFAESS